MLSGSRNRPRVGRHRAAWFVPPVLIGSVAAAFPPAAQLPAVSFLALGGAAVAVLLSKNGDAPWRSTLRDIAGLLAFLGFSAALVSDPADTLPLFDQRSR